MDLYVFGPDTAGYPFAGGSGSFTSEEQVDFKNPAAGVYLVVVHGYDTDGADSNYALFNWDIGTQNAQNTELNATSNARSGESETVIVNWSGLTPSRYLGQVSYHDVPDPIDYDDGLLNSTLLYVDAF